MNQSLKLALKSLSSSKMRSFLTMLGMIIGVGSVIILVSLMNGVTLYIADSFSDLGTNQITLSVTNTDTRFVDADIMYDFYEENADIFEAVSPTVSIRTTLKNGNTNITSTTVSGVGEGYLDINSLELSSGRFITYADIINRNKVCVVGTYVAEYLYEGLNPLGQTIKIAGEPYTIVGLLEEKADSTARSSDDVLYLAYTNATKLAWSASISSYVLSVYDTEQIETAKDRLDEMLYEIFKDEDLYTISSLTEILEMVESMTGMLTMVLVGIAAISLLVAGIGIMNIMLVSVTERTREIGIRKSLGAKRRVILEQFVIEAAVTSSIGGLLGIILGAIVTMAAGKLIGLNASPSVGAIGLAFGVSAGIGIIFGYMPANRAAKLNPIDALRSD